MSKHGAIYIQSKVMSVKCPEVEELDRICKNNDIQFDERFIRMDGMGPQASFIQPLISLVFTPEVIAGIASGLIAAGVYDLLKMACAKVVNAIRNQAPVNGKISRSSMIEIKAPSSSLRIEAEQVSDEVLAKAIDTFIEVSKVTCHMEHIIPTYIVIDENGNVVEMTQNEYILKYVANKKS